MTGWSGFENYYDFTTIRYRQAVCQADIAPTPNGDSEVGVSDVLAVIGTWGQCVDPISSADLSPPGGNDVVNVEELLEVIASCGPCP